MDRKKSPKAEDASFLRPGSAPPRWLVEAQGKTNVAANAAKRLHAAKPADWPHWSAMRTVQLWEAACLSLDLDPSCVTFSRTGWMAGMEYAAPPVMDVESFPTDEAHAAFVRRLAILSDRAADKTVFTQHWPGDSRAFRSRVLLVEFANFAERTWPENVPSGLQMLVDRNRVVLRNPDGSVNAATIKDGFHLEVERSPSAWAYLQPWALGNAPLAGLATLTVHQLMALVQYRVPHPPAGIDVYLCGAESFDEAQPEHFFVSVNEGEHKAAETLLADFLAFCASHKVRPKNPYARFLDDFDGRPGQSASYFLTVEESAPYLAGYGLDVQALSEPPKATAAPTVHQVMSKEGVVAGASTDPGSETTAPTVPKDPPSWRLRGGERERDITPDLRRVVQRMWKDGRSRPPKAIEVVEALDAAIRAGERMDCVLECLMDDGAHSSLKFTSKLGAVEEIDLKNIQKRLDRMIDEAR